jgi:SAM-dependent methyltransferase
MINPAEGCRDFSTCLITATNDCNSILDLGCGFGDKLALIRAPIRVGVDIHLPYLEEARELWPDITFVCQNAVEFIISCNDLYDAIILIDFIEHLPKELGIRFLNECHRVVKRRIIVWTPNGFYPQSHDAYEMNGEEWQTHRSGWVAEDLKPLGYKVTIWENFHENGMDAIFAIYQKWNRI